MSMKVHRILGIIGASANGISFFSPSPSLYSYQEPGNETNSLLESRNAMGVSHSHLHFFFQFSCVDLQEISN